MSWISDFFKPKSERAKQESETLKKNNQVSDKPSATYQDYYRHKKRFAKSLTPNDTNRAEWAAYFAVRHRTTAHNCAWCKYAKKDGAALTRCYANEEQTPLTMPFYYCKSFTKDTERTREYAEQRRMFTAMKGKEKNQ